MTRSRRMKPSGWIRAGPLLTSSSPPAPAPPTPPGQAGWQASAWTDEPDDRGGPGRVVMGLRRAWADASKAPLEGVQFHPESFLTDQGPRLLANFLAMGRTPAHAV